MDADGVLEPRQQPLGPLALGQPGPLAFVDERRRPPAAHLFPAVLEDKQMTGAQPLDLRAHRARLEDPAPGEQVVDGRGIEPRLHEPRGEERLELRRERETVPRASPHQRLDPQTVAGEHEPPAACVPEREREHPPEARGGSRVPGPRTGGRSSRRPTACGSGVRRSSVHRAARRGCRSRRCIRRRPSRPRWRSAGRRFRGRRWRAAGRRVRRRPKQTRPRRRARGGPARPPSS